MIAMLMSLLGALLAATSLTAFCYSSCSILMPTEARRARFCATVTLMIWLQGLLFYALLYSGNFTLVAGSTSFVIFAGLTVGLIRRHTARARDCLHHDLEALRGIGAIAFGPRIRWLTGISLALVLAHLLRAINAPPMAWDDLTYHLVRATLWAQHGEFTSYGAPGAWEYYLYFLPLGDALPAWGFLLTGSDVVVPLIGFGTWGLLLIAGYVLARELNASPERAYLAAWGAALVPAIAAHIFTAYVDNYTVLLQVCAFALLRHMVRKDDVPSGVFALIALGAAVAIKQTSVFFFVFGAVIFLIGLVRSSTPHKFRSLGIAATGILLIIVPPLIVNWTHTGSPTYPFALSIMDTTIFHGSVEYQWLSDSIGDLRSRFGYLVATFWGGYHGDPLIHKNFGPGTLVIAIAGILGLGAIYAEHKSPWWPMITVLWACILVALLVINFSGTGWNQGRFFAAAVVLFAAALASIDRRWVDGLLALFCIINLIFFLPINWSAIEFVAVGVLLALLLPFAAISMAIAFYCRQKSLRAFRLSLLSIPLLFVLFIATCIMPSRDIFRYTIYDAAGSGDSYLNTRVTGNHALGMPLSAAAEHIDDPDQPYVIAVTAGWDGKGHNWFVYPFFGSRLQNDVIYVPVTHSGALISPRHIDEIVQRADSAAWLTRLHEREVDYVVSLAPPTVEAEWMAGSSAFFEPIATAGHPWNRLYRVRAEELAQQFE